MSDKNETAAAAAADKTAKKSPAPASDPVMSPEDHARATGNTRRAFKRIALDGQPPSYEKFSAEHNAASVMHGWSHHPHEFGAAFSLSRSAYLGALEAAAVGDMPHAAAVSPVLEVRAKRAELLALKSVKNREKRAKRRTEERNQAARSR